MVLNLLNVNYIKLKHERYDVKKPTHHAGRYNDGFDDKKSKAFAALPFLDCEW
jgi:hypothetical protein